MTRKMKIGIVFSLMALSTLTTAAVYLFWIVWLGMAAKMINNDTEANMMLKLDASTEKNWL
jgi:hypothetical protein